MTAVTPLPSGISVHGYRILATLGSGSFGITYLADAGDGSIVALKELAPLAAVARARDAVTIVPAHHEFAATADAGVQRFLDEAALIRPVVHPNVVRIHDAFVENGTAYMVMDHLAGGSLTDRLRATTRLPSTTSVDGVHRGLVAGLAALHEHGVMHGDVRPPNILLTPDDTPVLVDFSTARRMGEGFDTVHLPRLRDPSSLAAAREMGDPVVDVYGLAATLYRVITGQPMPSFGTRKLMEPLVPLSWRLSRWFDPALLQAIDAVLNCDTADLPRSLAVWVAWTSGDIPASARCDHRTDRSDPDTALHPRPAYRLMPEPAPDGTRILGPPTTRWDALT